MQLKNLALLPMIISISCVYPSSVMSIGPDTYQVIGTSEFGEGSAKEVALQEAHKFAATKGLYIVVISDRQTNHRDAMRSMSGRMYSCEITFRLVSQNDPDYRRPDPTARPDIVLEKRLTTMAPPVTSGIPVPKAPSEITSAKYDQLVKLKKLLDDKIITEAEYNSEKAKILAQN